MALRQVVAANMRRLRAITPAQPEDVARAASQFGLEWTATWVASVEKGQKALSAEQLIALPFVLAIAFGHRVSMADLLLSEVPVELGKPGAGVPINAQYLRDVITDVPVRRSFVDNAAPVPVSPEPPPQAVQAAEKARLISGANLGHVDMRALRRAEEGSSDAETKLAKKLGVPEVVVVAASAVLWGRSLTEERDEQLAAGLAKTVVTRKLTGMLSNAIEEAAQGRWVRSPLMTPTMEMPAISSRFDLDDDEPVAAIEPSRVIESVVVRELEAGPPIVLSADGYPDPAPA